MNNGAIADKIEVTFFALTPASLEISFVAVAEVPPIKCFTILAPSSRSTFFKNDATLEIRSFACVANASSNPSLFVLLAACLDAPSKSLGSADFNTFVTSEVSGINIRSLVYLLNFILLIGTLPLKSTNVVGYEYSTF